MEYPRLPFQPSVVVTRHLGLIEAARACGLDEDIPAVAHATADIIRGKVVLGVLPLELAAVARAVISPVLEIAPNDRGRELTGMETLQRLRSWKVFAVLDGDELRNIHSSMENLSHDGDMALLKLNPSVRQKLGL